MPKGRQEPRPLVDASVRIPESMKELVAITPVIASASQSEAMYADGGRYQFGIALVLSEPLHVDGAFSVVMVAEMFAQFQRLMVGTFGEAITQAAAFMSLQDGIENAMEMDTDGVKVITAKLN